MNQNLPELEFAADNAHAGFRLHKLEILNWGTFNNKIWKVSSDGNNSLLTGDIGSGKSTIVDAITTLLVPHHKITFNKAAGSEKKERTLYSYIRGEYKTQKNTDTNSSKAIYLRNENDPDYCGYSVLLGYFFNDGYKQGTTIAQVFWLKDDKPQKLFVISDNEMHISHHFQGFGDNISFLKKQLQKVPATEVYAAFKDYNIQFRRLFGIRSDKALDLFYQTVSMKSVGNLTEFVRNQMLEKTEVGELIDDLKKNFDNLTRAHDAVEKAEQQKKELEPLVDTADTFENESLKLVQLNGTGEALTPFFAEKKAALLEEEIAVYREKIMVLENQLAELTADIEHLRESQTELEIAKNNNKAGQRIRELEKDIERYEDSKKKKSDNHNAYTQLAIKLDYPEKPARDQFYTLLNTAKNEKKELVEKIQSLVIERDNLVIEKDDLTRQQKTTQSELEALKNRKTSISKNNLDIRESMAHALDIAEEEVPFAGELIQVRDNEQAWEGAIERVLHNFGLSLLVPEHLYKRVSNYVNKTNLQGRLVYYRTRDTNTVSPNNNIEPLSLVNKLEIKSDTPFYDWIHNELSDRFNYYCCDTMEGFYHRAYAITKEGQIKGGKYRHEKDDRRNIFDRKHYILGWSNQAKITALETELKSINTRVNKVLYKISDMDKQNVSLRERDRDLDFFTSRTDFSDINWQADAEQIQALTEEITSLKKSSDELTALQNRLTEVENTIKKKSAERDNKVGRLSSLKNELEHDKLSLEKARKLADAFDEQSKDTFFPLIEEMTGKRPCTLNSIDDIRDRTRDELDEKKNRLGKKIQQLREKIIRQMDHYKNKYPADTTEVDSSIDSIPEFRNFLKKIEEDDLPKFRDRFRELLKEQTIRDIALFKQKLDHFAEDIESKIREINKSLKEIEYNSGTYITLVAEKVLDVEIKDFKTKLVNCLEGTLHEELYSEEKFKQVKAILDLFKEDLNWTNKVTDVRNWYDYSAIEKWQEDDEEKEIYSSSSGKSGGQKEKLAYTILASALAYQFGLKWNEVKSRSFRFVVIDEAFGRGSDESTRYGLELFKKLDLQLLIVTPLQKIYIIENYVSTINHVINTDGMDSRVRTLTWEEYQDGKKELMNESDPPDHT